MSLAILFASAVSIIFMIYHLYQARKIKNLQSKEFIQRLGALTEGQRTSSIPGVYWRTLIILRWTATMLIMTLLRHNFYIQIFSLLAISIVFQIMIVGSKPMQKKFDNIMQLFNEIMVSIYLYLLLCLTDFMREHDVREIIAWVLLSTVVFTVLVNLVKFLIFIDWKSLIRKIKKKFLKLKKNDKENQDKIKKDLNKFDNLTEIAGKSEKDEIKKRNKIDKNLAGPVNSISQSDFEIFKTQMHNEDPTKNGMDNNQSLMVASDFGGGFCYIIDEDEEIKQDGSNGGGFCYILDEEEEIKKDFSNKAPLHYSKNNNQIIVIESLNVDKEQKKSPFRQEQLERKRMNQQLQDMKWEIRKLPEVTKKDNMIPIKGKKNKLYFE